MPIPGDPALGVKVMSIKKEVMASVLSAGVRVNDQALRKKDTDKVADLLRRVKGQKTEATAPVAEVEVTKDELFG